MVPGLFMLIIENSAIRNEGKNGNPLLSGRRESAFDPRHSDDNETTEHNAFMIAHECRFTRVI